MFALNTNGTGFTNLHSFTALNSTNNTNSEGGNPNTALVLSGGALYGSALSGGSSGWGTVFAISTNGTGFTTLRSFTGGSEGGGTKGGVVLSGKVLYGTTTYGGSSNQGTVFSLSLEPKLTIVRSGTNAILSWPTNGVGFTLQSSTNLNSPAFPRLALSTGNIP